MVGVIAGAKVELRSLVGNWRMRLLVLLAMTFPLIGFVIQWVMGQLAGDEFSGGTNFGDMLVPIVVVAAGAVTLISATMATTAHRHRVFQSYAVTGRPRDLLMLGRIVAACLVALVIALGAMGSALIVHAVSAWNAPRNEHLFGPAVRPLHAPHVLADIASVVLLLLLVAAFTVGLATLVRSTAATLALIAFALFVDGLLVDAASSRWNERAARIPLARADDVTVAFADPWWSVTANVGHMLGHPHEPYWGTSVALLAGWVLVACFAGAYRLLWRDA